MKDRFQDGTAVQEAVLLPDVDDGGGDGYGTLCPGF